MSDSETCLCVVGGGPAGMMCGYLFARAGVKTVVLEKHGDFLRDFRGDTVHPSTLDLFDELGLLDALLERPHDRVTHVGGVVGGKEIRFADFTHLPKPGNFTALMPQWEFLDFLSEQARALPAFRLRMETEAVDLVREQGRVVGVRTRDGDVIRAKLTIAADGRGSVLRAAANLPLYDLGAPIDVFWFRMPKQRTPENRTQGYINHGQMVVLIDRGDYYQCAFVFPKGGAEKIRAEGLDAFRDRVRAIGPETATVDQGVTSWDDVKLLTVTVDRLDKWDRPGLLVIGDAAHAMSPIGGVGINLAVQDAVAAANILAAPMAAGEDPDPLLHKVYDRRIRAVKLTQGMQRMVQDTVVAPLLASTEPMDGPPLAAKLLDRIPLLRRIPAQVIGMGFRPEHVRSPEAKG